MKTLPKLGAKVKYRRLNSWGELREVTGRVVARFPGERYWDEEAQQYRRTPDHVSVKVDAVPCWWPYPGTDLFAPSVEELTLV